MGYLVQMNCKECGYQTHPIRFGATFSDPRIIGPALNAELKEIIEVDYNNIPAPSITPYTNKQLQKPGLLTSFTNIYNCWHHQIQGEGNFCPCCNGYSVSVVLGGLVD